jgi:hypothetical protein
MKNPLETIGGTILTGIVLAIVLNLIASLIA